MPAKRAERVAVLCAVTASLAVLVAGPSAQTAAVAPAFDAFLAAPSRDAAARLVDGIVRARITFDEAHRRLQRGRAYGPGKTGVVRLRNRTSDGVEHHYVLNVPDTYDPARRYQVRVHLHGGVGGRASNAPVGTGTIGALAGAEQIYVIPYAWNDAPWWSDDQILNLVEILDATKRLYNVDENRVVVSGVSDGGTGAYWVAMRETTPFASFLPLNGYWMVLASGDIDDGMLFANNLRSKPIFAVNGGRDRLYPPALVDPHIAHLKRGGVALDYRPQPEAGHNTAWWPEVKDAFETFVREHPRKPLPDVLTWETSRTTAGNRAHWLIIEPQMAVGPPCHLFARAAPTGRVDLTRSGNTVTATTRGVAAFTLLLSPDQFDFARPVKVVANGRTVFDGKVEKQLRTLLTFAAVDNDRTMLFGAELRIDLTR